MLENNRGLELDNESRVEVLINKETREYSDLLSEMSYSYMIVFGGDPYNEGAIHEDGTQISLNEYSDYVVESSYFQKDLNSDPSLHRVIKGDYDTKSLSALLKWVNNHHEKENIFDEVYRISDGYRPYYTHDGVLRRFLSDLEVTEGFTPIVCYWGDMEHIVCGALTGGVAQRREFFRVVENTPYLVRSYTNVKERVEEFLNGIEDTEFLLFESEGLVIPERRGREKGSRWIDMLINMRQEAAKMGAKYTSGFTSKTGAYYKNAEKYQPFAHQLDLNEEDGDAMVFFLSTLTD